MEDNPTNNNQQAESSPKKKNYPKIVLRWLLYLFSAIILLIIALYFAIQLPSVQSWGVKKVTAYFQKEWNTSVEIERFRLSLKDFLILEGVSIEDQQGESLIEIGELKTGFDTNILNVFRSRLKLQDVHLRKVNIHLEKMDGRYNFSFILDYFSNPNKERGANDFEFDIKKLLLEDIQFVLNDHDNQIFLESQLKFADFLFNSVDINRLEFNLSAIQIVKPRILLSLRNSMKMDDLESDEDLTESLLALTRDLDLGDISITDNTDQQSLSIRTESLTLSGGSFELNNFRRSETRTRPTDALDFDFLTLSNLNMDLEDARFKSFDIGAIICNINFDTDAGFAIEKMQASKFSMDTTELLIQNFLVQTPNSLLGDSLSFKYRSLDDFKEFSDRVFMDVLFRDVSFATEDLYYFAPELKDNTFFKRNRTGVVDIKGRVRGRINSLRGDDMVLTLAGKTKFIGNFGTRNLTEPSETVLNLDIESLSSTVASLRQLLPGFNLPAHFDRLGNIEFKGRFDGFYQDFVTFGDIKTDMGRATTDIQLNTIGGMKNATYKGKLGLKNFNVGRWLNYEDIGLLTFDAQVNNGRGLILETIQANLAAQVDLFQYKGYSYKNIDFTGKLVKNLIDGKVVVNDDNIDLTFDGSIDFTSEYPLFDFQSNIQLLDLYALNLMDRPLTLAGDFDLEVEYKSISEIEGFADIKDVVLSVETGDFMYIDRIYVDSRFKNTNEKTFSFNSEIMDFDLRGEFALQKLYSTIAKLIDKKHPAFASTLGLKIPKNGMYDHDFNFNLQIKNTKNLTQLLSIPIDEFKDLTFRGRFENTDSTNFEYRISELSVPNFQYQNIMLDSLRLVIMGNDDESTAIVHLDMLKIGSQEIHPVDGMVELKQDTLFFNMGTDNLTQSFQNLGIVGKMFTVEDRFHISFDNLEFDAIDTRWKIAEKNFLQFKKDWIYARNIRFTNGEGFVSLSTDNYKGAQISGNNIDISLFNKLLADEGIDLEGMATFQFSIDDYFALNKLRGSSTIKNFEFNKIKLGDARLVATQDDLESATLLELTIGDTGRDLKGRGYIKLPGIELDPGELRYSFDFFMNRFPLKPAEFFLDGLISETGGVFSGDFFIEGDSKIQNLGGDLNLLDASTKIDYLGTRYFIKNSRIKIDNKIIDLNNVKLHDINDNPAEVRGVINHDKFNNLVTDFRITSPAFTILNTRKIDNDLFYGRASGRIDVTFNGPFNAIDLYVNATTGPNTVVAIPLTSAKEIKEQNFIIFVNRDDGEDEVKIDRSTGGLALRMDLTVTPEAQLQLIFDERTGDIVKGSGNGNIQLEMPRNGDFQMFGDFVISKGEYPFRAAYLLDKAFTVKEGGTIAWTGDPLNAFIELEAEYKGLKTSPFNLISEYLREEELREQARRPTEVDLTLNLTGPLLQPDIQFEIQFPTLTGELRNYTENKLRTLSSDQNEINNLAFQLLFFKSFIPNQTDIISTQGGLGIASSTLTEWFTNQMRVFVNEYLIDTISNKMVSDVDLDFGIILNNDYSQNLEGLVAAGQSQFYVRPRVQMFDDRVILDFGINNYGRLGSDNRIAGEFNLEYAFGGSRRFRARVYSQDQPLPVNGRRTVFGAGLVYRREYDEFMDIFRWGTKKNKNEPSNQNDNQINIPPPSTILPDQDGKPLEGED